METGNKTQREKIVTQARSWLGTPFAHQGRVKGVGVDCVGLVICVAKELRIYDYDYQNYRIIPNPKMMERQLQNNLIEKNFSDIKDGDILWFRVKQYPQHLGIKTDTGFIHAYSPNQKVLEVDFCKQWEKLLYKVFQYHGVTD